ncbi:uncharacterized protein LOC119192156 [Manduca sexta]|uniref:uncharacterized protein LOC119192156 n=1 Tax=Manduca sexta TaxID=7130 RepID=UPI001890582D|nr:uncharacterized protein LOC119192156 [Manduca sexta]
MAPLRFLQANINHCARAQDLLLQSMARWSINIAVVSEPYFVPPRNDWVEDLSGSVAIIASAAAGTLTHERVKRGQGCVAARFGGIVVVGCYFSPSRTLAEFHNSLRELSDVVVEYGSLPVVVLGTLTPRARLGVPGTRMYGGEWLRTGPWRLAWTSSTAVPSPCVCGCGVSPWWTFRLPAPHCRSVLSTGE